MRGMGGWSWDELETTPLYVRRFCAHFIELEGDVAKDQQRDAELRQEAMRRGR